MIGGRVLDLSALRAFAGQTSIYANALVWTAVDEDIVLLVPSTATSLAWAELDPSAHPVLEVLLGLPVTVIDELTSTRSRELGQLLRTNELRIDHGHAAVCALERGWPLITDESDKYWALEPTLAIEPLP